MKKILLLLLMILISVSIQAQIPAQIKERLVQLTAKADQQTDVSAIKKHIAKFIASAPNEASKKEALAFIKKKSKSAKVKAAVTQLLNAKKNAPKKATKQQASYIFLKNATIIDMLSEKPKRGSILIKGDKIEKIDYQNRLKAPADAQVYDLNGKYIIPGLIDAHVHITHGTYDDAKESIEQALKGGVTGVRDMGGDGRILTLLKRNTLISEIDGADVYFSTIIAGPEFFERDPRPQQVAKGAIAGEVSWQRAITNKTDLKQVVAEAKGMGATAIKVYLNVEKNLFKKIADECKRQGVLVWAHAAVPPTKAIDITNGGALAMSHAGDMIQYEFVKGDLKGRHDFANREEALAYRKQLNSVQWDENTPEVKRLFKAMRKNNSILDATLHIYSLDRKSQKGVDDAYRAVRIAHKMGVKIAAGTDNIIDRKTKAVNIHGEMKNLTKAGLSNYEALKAATVINAEVVGASKTVGTIEQGKIANLVVLDKSPLKDISNTKTIQYVFKRGKKID